MNRLLLARQLISAARELLGAPKPMKEEKILDLLRKLRKNSATGIQGKAMRAILGYLGWKVENLKGWHQVDSYGTDSTERQRHGEATEEAAQAYREMLLSRSGTELPDPDSYDGYEWFMNVGPVEKGERSYQVSYDRYLLSRATRLTSPSGATKTFWLSQDAFDGAYMLTVGVLKWLRNDTEFLQQISDKLGLPTFETEKAEKERVRTTPKNDKEGTCGACFGVYKLTPRNQMGADSSMPGVVLHGYNRPGTGNIHGSCLGVQYPPYELSLEATKVALAAATQALQRYEKDLAHLETDPPDVLHVLRNNKLVQVEKAKDSGDHAQVLRSKIGDLRVSIRQTTDTVSFLTAKERAWKAPPSADDRRPEP